MEKILRQLIVPYQPEQMYGLVDNIKNYPEFLPWCTNAVEHQRNAEQVDASLTLSWAGISYSFTTRNLLEPHTKIGLELLEGPFKKLSGCWEFKKLGDEGCKVSLQMEFEFSNALMAMAFGRIFKHSSETLLDAFYQRACELYATN